jgi:HK97 family phage prohead protease
MKMRELNYKSCLTSVKEVDEKGWVLFYPSIFGNKDRQGEIVDRGAYAKTIKENFEEIQHYKNHDSSTIIGVLHELSEDQIGLLAKSKLILTTKAGMETYEQYKAMAEAGKSMPHSVAVYTVKEERKEDGLHLKELYLGEVSTLTKRASNPLARNIGLKEFDEMELSELLKEETFYEAMLNSKFDDVELEKLEKIKDHITALIQEKAGKPLDTVEPQGVDFNKIIQSLKSQ